jgi:sporulation protein YlmC with PRC-barrel domain
LDGRVFLGEMLGKRVETSSGRYLGMLDDLVIDTVSGTIVYILVSPSGAVYLKEHKVDERGRYVIQTDGFRLESDRVVID